MDAEPQHKQNRVAGLVGATVFGPLQKLNRGNKFCIMCTDPFPHTRDSQHKFSSARLELYNTSLAVHA